MILLDGRSNTIYTIVDKLRHLPQHTAVLIGTWRIDMNEGYFMRNATYSMMEANPSLPVFTLTSVGFGYWAIGGVMPAYRELGQEMANEVLRVLRDSERQTQNVQVIPNEILIDYNKSKELSLKIKSLPFEVRFVNQPVSFYQQYKLHIWTFSSILIILLVGLIISLLFYFRMKRLKNKLQRSEIDLRESRDRAEESNRLKSAFLANMSHEIRTPLNAIVGFSDVLTSDEMAHDEMVIYNEIIKSNADLLLRLINDILDLSRLESGKVELNLESFVVILACKQILTSVRFARSSDNHFLFESECSEFTLSTDMQRLQQVIINLLSNANKFTKNGTITLSVTIDQSDNRVLFSVTDTGCGIPKEKQCLVFERFEKLNEYAQGTGLGLAICKLTVSRWGGEIWIDSDYTNGARFVFSHPIQINVGTRAEG